MRYCTNTTHIFIHRGSSACKEIIDFWQGDLWVYSVDVEFN